MTYAPPTLSELGKFWVAQGGRNLGIVGDTRHQAKGTSYHLGRSQLATGAYSARTARDKRGLTDAASAIDLGLLGGSLARLRDFSLWLLGECRRNAAGTSDIRELIYWDPVRNAVMRWDRERGSASQPKTGEADMSHRTHTHVSYYRDSEKRPKVAVFRPYFREAPTVDQFITYATPKVATVAAGTWIYDNEACASSAGNIQVDPGRDMPVAGKTVAGVHILGYVDTSPTETELKTYWAKAGSVMLKDAATGGCSPDQLTAATRAGARAEYDRQAAAATVVVELAPPRP